MVARILWDDKDQDPNIPSLELLEWFRRMIHYNEYAMMAYDSVWDAMFYTKPNQCNLHNDTE